MTHYAFVLHNIFIVNYLLLL